MSRRLTPEEQRHLTARHEAGHVVLDLLNGMKFNHVWIGQDWDFQEPDDGPEGAVAGSDFLDNAASFNEQQRETAGICVMAGLAGERIDRRCGSAWRGRSCVPSADSDIGIIQDYDLAGVEGGDDTDIIDRWLSIAHGVLIKHRELHTRLTDALMEKGRLEYSECVAIYESLQPESVDVAKLESLNTISPPSPRVNASCTAVHPTPA